MCKEHGKNKIDNRILKPKKGEMFSINSKNLTDSDCQTINNFIRFARAVTKIKKDGERNFNKGTSNHQ